MLIATAPNRFLLSTRQQGDQRRVLFFSLNRYGGWQECHSIATRKKQSYQKHPSFKVQKIGSKPGNIRGLDAPKDKFKLGSRMITVQPQDWNPASMCSQKGRYAASLNIYVTHHGLLTTTSSKQNFWINCCWLVVYLLYPSEKYEFISWDDEIPNIWKVKKFMLQTTNQVGMAHRQYSPCFLLGIVMKFHTSKDFPPTSGTCWRHKSISSWEIWQTCLVTGRFRFVRVARLNWNWRDNPVSLWNQGCFGKEEFLGFVAKQMEESSVGIHGSCCGLDCFLHWNRISGGRSTVNPISRLRGHGWSSFHRWNVGEATCFKLPFGSIQFE